MVISGIFLKANEARIVTITGSKDAHKLVAPKINKLSLPKNPTQDDVDVFSQAFKAYWDQGVRELETENDRLRINDQDLCPFESKVNVLNCTAHVSVAKHADFYDFDS